MSGAPLTLIKKLSTTISLLDDEYAKANDQESGNISAKWYKDQTENWSANLHNALKDLVVNDTEGFKASKTHLFDTLLPQLKLLNELMTIIHSFPHHQLPATQAIVADLTNRSQYVMNNISNFGDSGGIFTNDPVLHNAVGSQNLPIPYRHPVLAGGNQDAGCDDCSGGSDVEVLSISSKSSSGSKKRSSKSKSKPKTSKPTKTSSKSKSSKSGKVIELHGGIDLSNINPHQFLSGGIKKRKKVKKTTSKSKKPRSRANSRSL
jgi:hypothetical protein